MNQNVVMINVIKLKWISWSVISLRCYKKASNQPGIENLKFYSVRLLRQINLCSNVFKWILVFWNRTTHMFSFQQFYTFFVPVATTGHPRMNASMIPARKNCHTGARVCRPSQLSSNLSYLLVCSSSKIYFGDEWLSSIFLPLCITSIFTIFFWRTGTLSTKDGRLQPEQDKA